MPQFGTTSPCAEIAKHFGAPQAYVDASMEHRLFARGIRTSAPDHIGNYVPVPLGVAPEIYDGIMAALDETIERMSPRTKPRPKNPLDACPSSWIGNDVHATDTR